MYTRPSLQKTQEFRPIPGHHQPKLAAWSSVLLDRRSGCEHQHFFLLCCCPSSPAVVVEAPAEKFKNEEEENRSVHAVLSPLLAWSLLPSARYCVYQLPFFFLLLRAISSLAIADSVYVKMTLNFLFKNSNVIPFLLCPPRPLFLTA